MLARGRAESLQVLLLLLLKNEMRTCVLSSNSTGTQNKAPRRAWQRCLTANARARAR